MAGSLPLKNDVQFVTQFPQSRRQALDVLSAAESVLPISDSEVTCGPMAKPATLNSSATSSSNSTDFSSSSSSSISKTIRSNFLHTLRRSMIVARSLSDDDVKCVMKFRFYR